MTTQLNKESSVKTIDRVAGGGVPANAIILRNGSPITLRDGSNLTARAA